MEPWFQQTIRARAIENTTTKEQRSHIPISKRYSSSWADVTVTASQSSGQLFLEKCARALQAPFAASCSICKHLLIAARVVSKGSRLAKRPAPCLRAARSESSQSPGTSGPGVPGPTPSLWVLCRRAPRPTPRGWLPAWTRPASASAPCVLPRRSDATARTAR